jgi:hypothetical protein
MRDWVVYAKPPFGGPEQVLKYLARYTHRVAISNQRILSVENGRVTFRWKDYAQGNRQRTMTLDAVEFIRRFLLHALPNGFQRIRHFGLLANRVRQEKLHLCRQLLDQVGHYPEVGVHDATSEGDPDSATQPRDDPCPACKIGHMHVVETIEPRSPADLACAQTLSFDTS